MKKKIISWMLVAMLCMSLMAGCGKDNKNPENKPTDASPTHAAPTEAPVEEAKIMYTVPSEVLDNIYPVIMPEKIQVTEEMSEKAILNMGNTQRVAKVLAKAAEGKPVTIAYIGGSITNGDSASPKNKMCYEARMREWWTETFPKSEITFVNAGIGATDSLLGVHRAKKDVLSYDPDLVVVEFSVNDSGRDATESYESLCRMLLNHTTEPAVISLIITQKTNYNEGHMAVAKALDIPMISEAYLAKMNMADGTWDWSDIGAADGTHPINDGHAVIANLLSYYFTKVLTSINETGYTEYKLPEKTKSLSRYENANLIYAEDAEVVKSEGFELVDINSNLPMKKGYKTTSAGSITFKLSTKSAGFIFWGLKSGSGATYDVLINGEKVSTVNSDFSNQWGSYAKLVTLGNNKETKDMEITFEPSEKNTNTDFIILAISKAD